MATSGSVNFNQTCIEIIKDALVLVGAIEGEATPSAQQYAYTRRALNRMVNAWSVKGLKAWKWEEATLTLVAGTNQYDIGPGGDLVINRPVEIQNVRRVVSGEEVEIRIGSRNEFMSQPAKDSEGKAVLVFYDPQRTVGQMWVWPTPDAADSIKFSYKSYIEDFDDLNDDPEFPPEWLDAIVYNLAVRLMPKYEVRGEEAMRITDLAAQLLYEAETNDIDQGSVFLMPEMYQ